MKKRIFLLPLIAGLLASCEPTQHQHKFSTDWKTNASEHWHVCECGEKSDVADHFDDNSDGKCDACDYELDGSVKSISLNKTSLTLEEGTSETLTYTIDPKYALNKNVSWESSNTFVASVEEGVVKAWNPGTANITVTTEDGEKTANCAVTVTKAEHKQKTIDENYNVNEQGYTNDSYDIDDQTLTLTTNFSASFSKGTNTVTPKIMKYDSEKKDEKYSIRTYAGNTFTISSEEKEITKISMVFSSKKDQGNTLSVSTGTIVDDVWTGNSKSVEYTVATKTAGKLDGYRAIQQIIITYAGEPEDDPEVVINLGEKSIAEVKDYIAEHPVKKNAFGNGVNEKRYVTIKGFALAKIDLEKFTSKFGLDVSEHGKVIMADETGFIGVATKVNSQGTCLWGKIGEHICKPTSKYIVTGYISEYLGHPELLVTSFVWDQNLDITLDLSKISAGVKTLSEFYTDAANNNYNCAGHGYGDIITIKDLKCYYSESDGQGIRYYNFTDGSKNIRINAYNIANATVGNVYDVTGVISIKNLSPIIVAFEFKSSSSTVDFDYQAASTPITVAELRTIKGSQDDTSERFPNVINAYGNFYKTTGYMVMVEEGGKLYIGMSDTYHDKVISGKTNAMTNYGVTLIKNDNFWNVTEQQLALFNPYYEEYICENKTVDVYYVTRQLAYSDKKPMWEILLVPQSIPVPVKA